MNTKYSNGQYDGSDIPYAAGDRRYGQDFNRDMYNNKEYGAIIAGAIVNRSGNTIINGGNIVQGAGHTINITAGFGVVTYSVKVPSSWVSLPPTIGSVDMPIVVEIPSLTNEPITGAVTDGVTINYVKIAYFENLTSTRSRVKKAGSYSSETISSYTLTVNSTAPTAYELQLARFTTNGSTITFVGQEARGVNVTNLVIKPLVGDYTITDVDGVQVIESDPTITRNTITLPTLADNLGRPLRILNIADGLTMVDGEGSETINGNLTMTIFNKYDFIELIAGTTEWEVAHICRKMDMGFVQRTTWQGAQPGTVVINVDTGSIPLGYEFGEIVSDTVVTGRIINIVDNADGTGQIFVYKTTGTGNFTNNNTLTGANSSATSLVNETSGSTKNGISNVFHGENVSKSEYTTRFFISSDGSEGNILDFSNSQFSDGTGSARFGQTFFGVDLDNYKLITGLDGIRYADSTGSTATLSNGTNWWYKHVWEQHW